MTTRLLRMAAPLAIVPVLLAGCAMFSSDMPATTVSLSAAAGLNPDEMQRPCPVVVRLYELTAREDFERADFFSLYDHDKEVLGKAALARIVLTVRPGQVVRLDDSLDPRARYLGVMVAYRDIYHAEWRAVVDLSRGKNHAWRIRLGASAASVVSVDPRSPEAAQARSAASAAGWRSLQAPANVSNGMPKVSKALVPALAAPALQEPLQKLPQQVQAQAQGVPKLMAEHAR